MSNSISLGVSRTEYNDKTRCLKGHELANVNSAGSSQRDVVTSEEVAREFQTATYPLSNQLQLLFDLLKDLHQSPLRRTEETSSLIQGYSKALNHRSDNQFQF